MHTWVLRLRLAWDHPAGLLRPHITCPPDALIVLCSGFVCLAASLSVTLHGFIPAELLHVTLPASAGCSVFHHLLANSRHFCGVNSLCSRCATEAEHGHSAQEIVTAAGGGGNPGPLTVASVPASAGGGPPAEATLQHFVFHAPPRRQFLMPLLSADESERSRNQARP